MDTKTKLEFEETFLAQTLAWQRRFRELEEVSPQKKWNWIVGHFQGDQDDLDHLINKYEKHKQGPVEKLTTWQANLGKHEKKRGIEK